MKFNKSTRKKKGKQRSNKNKKTNKQTNKQKLPEVANHKSCGGTNLVTKKLHCGGSDSFFSFLSYIIPFCEMLFVRISNKALFSVMSFALFYVLNFCTYPADMITKTTTIFLDNINEGLRRGSPSFLQRAVQRNLFSSLFWSIELLLYLPLKQEEKVLFRTFRASSAWQSHYTRRVFPTQLTS